MATPHPPSHHQPHPPSRSTLSSKHEGNAASLTTSLSSSTAIPPSSLLPPRAGGGKGRRETEEAWTEENQGAGVTARDYKGNGQHEGERGRDRRPDSDPGRRGGDARRGEGGSRGGGEGGGERGRRGDGSQVGGRDEPRHLTDPRIASLDHTPLPRPLPPPSSSSLPPPHSAESQPSSSSTHRAAASHSAPAAPVSDDRFTIPPDREAAFAEFKRAYPVR